MSRAGWYSVGFGLVVALVAIVAAQYSVAPQSPRSPVADPRAGLEVERVDGAGRPTPEKLAEALDKVEKAEAERFGPEEAHRRRVQRERIMDQRTNRR
ncbi:MAG: hypothetical protein ABMA64_39305 [Myxococcota bacterium]